MQKVHGNLWWYGDYYVPLHPERAFFGFVKNV